MVPDSGKRKKRGNDLEQIDCTPPEHILPGSKDCPLVPLQPLNKDWKVRNSLNSVEFYSMLKSCPVMKLIVIQEYFHSCTVKCTVVKFQKSNLWSICRPQPMQCLKVLTMSGWNPPPGNRKMHGDLMYLYIVTVEERHVSITASTRGFYLNQSVNISR